MSGAGEASGGRGDRGWSRANRAMEGWNVERSSPGVVQSSRLDSGAPVRMMSLPVMAEAGRPGT